MARKRRDERGEDGFGVSRRREIETAFDIANLLEEIKDRINDAITFTHFDSFFDGLEDQVSISDTFSNLNDQVRLVVDSLGDVMLAQEALLSVSEKSRSDLVSTTDVYTGLARSAQELGLNQGRLLGLTESVNQAVKISGSSPSEAAAGIAEFEAALSLGRISAENFETILKNIPELAHAIAAGLDGRTVREALELIETQGLSAEDALRAVESQAQSLGRRFGSLTPTVQEQRVLADNARIQTLGFRSSFGAHENLVDKAEEETEKIIDSLDIFRVFRGPEELIRRMNELDAEIESGGGDFTEERAELQQIQQFLHMWRNFRANLPKSPPTNIERPVKPGGSSLILASAESGGVSLVPNSSGGAGFGIPVPRIKRGEQTQSAAFMPGGPLPGIGGGAPSDELSRPFVESSAAIEDWADQFSRAAAEVSGESLPTISEALDENLVGGLEDAKAKTQETLGEIGQLFDDVAGRAIDRLGDEIVELSLDFESLKEIGKAALQELIKGVQDLLQEMLRAEVISPAKSAAKDVASDVFSSIFTSFFAGGFQHGGTIPRGQFGVVGEAGPELAFAGVGGVDVVPPRSPSLSSLGSRGGGGANVVVNQSFDFRNADNGTVARLRQESERSAVRTSPRRAKAAARRDWPPPERLAA